MLKGKQIELEIDKLAIPFGWRYAFLRVALLLVCILIQVYDACL